MKLPTLKDGQKKPFYRTLFPKKWAKKLLIFRAGSLMERAIIARF